ncbi:MAG: J domain-containing protein [Sphingobacteriia bacterium]|nr:MAG: J domain-containing protein [Sphingobacteriia bacterium]
MEPDWYQVLGIPIQANAQAIKAAFRQKARLTHPDKTQQEDAGAFHLIRKAHDILLDPVRRREYDLRRKTIGVYPQPYFPQTQQDWIKLFQQTLTKYKAQTWQNKNLDLNYLWLAEHDAAWSEQNHLNEPSFDSTEKLKLLLAFLPHLHARDQKYFLQQWRRKFLNDKDLHRIDAVQRQLYWHQVWHQYQWAWVLLMTVLILAGLLLF